MKKKKELFASSFFSPHAFAFHPSHFHSFPRPHFTERLRDYNNCSKSSTSTGRNICSTSSGSFSPQKICSYFSSLMHSCPSFCSEERFRTLSSLRVTISSCRRRGRNYLKSCDTGGGEHLPDFWKWAYAGPSPVIIYSPGFNNF